MVYRGWVTGAISPARDWERPRTFRVDDELNVLVEIDPQVCRAVHHVLTAHAPCKRLVLHFFSNGTSLDVADAPRRLDERGRRDEASQLIDGEQAFGHARLAPLPSRRRGPESPGAH